MGVYIRGRNKNKLLMMGFDESCLVEVPEPHGDLIDRNKVSAEYRGGFHDDFLVAYDSVYGQKAVIKAEGETARDPWKEMFGGEQ